MSATRSHPRHHIALSLAVTGALALTGCGSPNHPSTAAGKSLVIADSRDVNKYNPLDGHGEHGNSPIYDGLLQMESSADTSPPQLKPALADKLPETSEDGLTWTVSLRKDVTFSDGTTFDADDVVATYRSIADPKVATSYASELAMMESVEAVDPHTVKFTLKKPYAEFGSRMLMGIAPSEKLDGSPVDKSPLNSKPVGTGPYVLAESSAEKAVFTANPKHWRGKPEIEKVTYIRVADDNTRAQRMAAGEIDGTVLPPTLAATLKNKDNLVHTSVRSVDFRAISLPKTSAFAQDPVGRMAMNQAVDRQAMVDKILAGEGSPATTPVPAEMGDAHEPGATIAHDVAAAEKALDAAGWVKGDDGVRAKDGQRAGFTLMYAAADTVRSQIAIAFAADMKKIGVDITLEGSTWDKIEPQLGKAGLVLGSGKHPTSIDSLLYNPLHRRDANTTSPYSNPGNYGSETLDNLLETARHEQDPAARAKTYRDLQTEYAKDPGSVFLLTLRHTYVAKKGAPGAGKTILEPHVHDAGWGPRWNLGRTR
ncbi:peptide/nickel transport system substrate-binding protein [Austwickia chelonae]|uniref:Putative ABC transporter substrate-binding protein n=1 Tax=Austwickia chelonae NBRC 105200 TaxID=1184607 RepID=K6V938_9MICO|nr:ABC transporter substrate-binding protein [Austwickia chelonae]GAB78748.1 putative ABC transporter substrate-binding protein [Austwickia chelonae NBRC 105200]SEW35220.1 peptide/nickel transport system substrate-binding protein [Austwickia chelonae]